MTRRKRRIKTYSTKQKEEDVQEKEDEGIDHEIFIWHSNHRVYIDITKFSWPKDQDPAFTDFYNHENYTTKKRCFFVFTRSKADCSSKTVVYGIMCIYHAVGCYVIEHYNFRVSKKDKKKNRSIDEQNPFRTPLKVYNHFCGKRGGIFLNEQYMDNFLQ